MYKGGVKVQREVHGPCKEPEWPPIDEQRVLEEHLKEIVMVLEFDEEVTIVKGAEKKISTEGKPLHQVASNVLEGGRPRRVLAMRACWSGLQEV